MPIFRCDALATCICGACNNRASQITSKYAASHEQTSFWRRESRQVLSIRVSKQLSAWKTEAHSSLGCPSRCFAHTCRWPRNSTSRCKNRRSQAGLRTINGRGVSSPTAGNRSQLTYNHCCAALSRHIRLAVGATVIAGRKHAIAMPRSHDQMQHCALCIQGTGPHDNSRSRLTPRAALAVRERTAFVIVRQGVQEAFPVAALSIAEAGAGKRPWMGDSFSLSTSTLESRTPNDSHMLERALSERV